jgi:hypothetical protein
VFIVLISRVKGIFLALSEGVSVFLYGYTSEKGLLVAIEPESL